MSETFLCTLKIDRIDNSNAFPLGPAACFNGLRDHGSAFQIVVDDDVKMPKPSPEGIVIALDALGVAAANTIYIGDSLTDLEAGSAAGTKVAGALWGKTDARKQHFIDNCPQGARLLYDPIDVLDI